LPIEDKALTTQDLIDKVTNDKQKLFLENYHKFMRNKWTAEAIGVDESTVYRWMQRGGVFLQAIQALKKELEPVMIDRHLENIHDITFDVKTPPQTRLLGSFFELKALDSRYKDKVLPDINVSGDIIFRSSMPDDTIEGEYKEVDNAIQEQGTSKGLLEGQEESAKDVQP